MSNETITRRACVSAPADRVRPYLPANYEVVSRDGTDACVISGHDNAGWTMDDYVIPRLASGLMVCVELSAEEVDDINAALEYLRGEIRAECISMGELLYLQGMAEHIDRDDVELLEPAGVPEFPED